MVFIGKQTIDTTTIHKITISIVPCIYLTTPPQDPNALAQNFTCFSDRMNCERIIGVWLQLYSQTPLSHFFDVTAAKFDRPSSVVYLI
jgi:hypothetical protein